MPRPPPMAQGGQRRKPCRVGAQQRRRENGSCAWLVLVDLGIVVAALVLLYAVLDWQRYEVYKLLLACSFRWRS